MMTWTFSEVVVCVGSEEDPKLTLGGAVLLTGEVPTGEASQRGFGKLRFLVLSSGKNQKSPSKISFLE